VKPNVPAVFCAALLFGSTASTAWAAGETTLRYLLQKIEDLQGEVTTLRERVSELERERPTSTAPVPSPAPAGQPLSSLVDDFLDRTTADVGDDEPAAAVKFTSGQRSQQALNPNISLTGDFVGSSSTRESGEGFSLDDFALREAEIGIEAPLDPFSYAKAMFAHDGDAFHIEELYVRFDNFGRRTRLEAGKFKTQLGLLNRWHPHAWPQVDASLVHRHIAFDAELTGTGISCEYTAPRLWSDATRLTLQLVYPDEAEAEAPPALAPLFSANERDTPLKIAHLKSFWGKREGFVEVGLTGAWGETDPVLERDARLVGVDFTWDWTPTGREKYDGVTVRGEWFRLDEDQGGPDDVTRDGHYLYAEKRLDAKYLIGLRWDRTEFRDQPGLSARALSPYVTIWQSEFTRYRLQYTHEERSDGTDDNRVLFQTTFSLGPHKHEEY